jgi:MraZ protein
MLPDSKVGPLKQFIYSKTINVIPDSNGRVVLTPALTAYAEIAKNVVIIGVGDHAQIWSEEAWNAKEESVDLAAIADLLAQVGL